MQAIVLFLVLLLIWMQGVVDSVRIVDLRVSAHMAEGSDALLGCSFDTGSEALYSLKWYKDDKEFFRYVPKSYPVMKSFFVSGVTVDLNRSSVNVVALKQLSRDSAGVYQCEVKAEGPTFAMVTQEKRVAIDLLPKSGPQIHGLQEMYRIGSIVDLNCSTTPSRPEAQLRWLINGLSAPSSYLRGPFLVIPTDRPFTYQSKLNLRFVVQPGHFNLQGAMILKCLATIPPLYHQETQYAFYEPIFQTTVSPETPAEQNRAAVAMSDIPILLLIILVIALFHVGEC